MITLALWKQIENDHATEGRKTGDRRAGQRRQFTRAKKKFIAANPMCAVFPQLKSTSVHHKFGRLGELLLWEPGWVATSQAGHVKIHSEINWAREAGLLGASGTWNNYEKAKCLP